MNRSRSIRIDASWIALPGLFTADELDSIEELEIYAVPLVLRGNDILYGVYVRELDACLGEPTPFAGRARRTSIEPAAPR